MAKRKNVYFFGNGVAEGDASLKNILGGKGANLAEMTNLGIPVPPGFTISTEVCAAYYANNKQYPASLENDVLRNLAKLEKVMGKGLGNPNDPLLVSVRSGAPVSMPGMMDTILNLGISDASVQGLIKHTNNPRFAWDAYRRFIQMYGDVVMGVEHARFEEAIRTKKSQRGISLDIDLNAGDLQDLVKQYKEIVKIATGKEFPQDPYDQLWGAIGAVFESWNNERAIKYRELNEIKDVKGTAINVQSMVFGNFGSDSGTGVCFSRNPSTGEKIFYGEYLMNAQGEDVVAGIRTPEKIDQLEQENKAVYDQLVKIKNLLERHFKDMQDIEFTVYQGKLFILQTRNAKRTGPAAVRCAVDMFREKRIDKKTAIMRVTPQDIDQILHPRIDPDALLSAHILTTGLNASPGAGTGRIVFNAPDAEAWHERGEKVLLVRQDTSPEDISGMSVSQGILTATGGMTSHAAVVARGMGTPCVAGAKGISVQEKKLIIGGQTFSEGDWISIDGSTGEVFEGRLPLVAAEISEDMQVFLKWCDEIRASSVRGSVNGFEVRANADQPEDARRAFEFGAQGVGLCRTEHMFFAPEKLIHFRAMIAADTTEGRKEALQKILPLQRKDFLGILEAMEGRPVTIRLLDPPLHEFVPKTPEEIKQLADYLHVDPESLKPKLERLKEQNPMLGHRGCRLAVTYPEIYDMQVEAIALAAVDCLKRTIPVNMEIMIPIVCDDLELALLRPQIEQIIKEVFSREGVSTPVRIGTMIEVPRAALLADEIAKYADFFSFGTNDLTQMTFAFSRDDIASFLPAYLSKKLLEVDPFRSIDEKGVGSLIQNATIKGRSVKPTLKVGICGEHGGDPASVDFCYRANLSYVSCSPFRVPLARLAGAQAVLRNLSLTATLKKRGRPVGYKVGAKKAEPDKAISAAPKKRGRPVGYKVGAKKAEPDKVTPAAPKKRGRPVGYKVGAKKAEPDKVIPAAPKKRGRPVGYKVGAKKAEPDKVIPAAPKKRGRPVGYKVGAKKAEPDKVIPAAPKKMGRPPKVKPEPEKVTKTNKTTFSGSELPPSIPRGRRPKKDK
ncbi:pyruvate, phosphate dikinase [Spirochaetia bacterium]|nr:pyruvate, phosphate dikinase [Spirochaetia bacterium]